jgi:DNA-binding CsgD family transcriptional regulator
MPRALLDVDRVERLAQARLAHGELVSGADELLRPAIGYDGAAWAAVDPSSLLLTSCTPVGFHPHTPEQRFRIFERESEGRHHTTVRRLVRRDPPVTSRRGDDQARYAGESFGSRDIADELVGALMVDGQCWGAVRLWRVGRATRPFRDRDADRLAALSRPLGAGLRRAFLRAATAADGGVDDPPGIVTVDGTGRTVTASHDAHAWLDRLGEPADTIDTANAVDTGDTATVSTALWSLAARVSTHGTASAVVAGPGGPVALHASRLGGDGDDGRVAVVLAHPRPSELTPRVLEAYDLTPREREVTALVLRGGTTAQIARALGVSRYTVQDHLKSVFAKVGVQTRGELAHAVHVRLSLPSAHPDLNETGTNSRGNGDGTSTSTASQ